MSGRGENWFKWFEYRPRELTFSEFTCTAIGQLQLSEYTCRWKVVLEPPSSLRHQQQQTQEAFRKMCSVDSCQFTGPCHFSDAPLFRPLVRGRTMERWIPFTQFFSTMSEESKPKFLFANSFSTMAEITPTSLYLLWKNQRVGEADAVFQIQNIREYPRQFGRSATNE